MFLKPKTSQLNYLATLYKETLDITRYINATTVFRTLLSNSTYKYWVYDTDNACMVEIENKTYDNVISVTNDKSYYLNNNFWVWQNDKWKKIYSSFNDIEIKDEFYYNYNNLIADETNTILDYFRSYYTLIEEKAQIDADNNGTSISKVTLSIFIGNVTINNLTNMLQVCYEKDLQWNVEMLSFKYYNALILNPPVTTRYMYLNNNGNVTVDFPNVSLGITEYLGTLLDTPYDIVVEFDDNSDDYYDVELPNYEKIVALLFNDTGFRNVNLPIDDNFIDKQQKVYYLNKGEFDYCINGDINVVNQQIIKGLNFEFKTFEIKTSSDLGLGNQDIVKLLNEETNTYEYYITSDINYKTIRLPKPMKYTFCTLTQLKTK